MKKIRHSILLSATLLFTSCASLTKENISNNNQPELINKIENKNDLKRSFNIQVGDNENTIFERLSGIDQNIYILDGELKFSSKISVNNIETLEDLVKFFKANKHILKTENIENSKYVKVFIYPENSKAENKLKNTKVSINGTIPIGDAISMITDKAKVNIVWEDKTANNISLINRTFNFSGDGLEGLSYIANSADINMQFKEDKVFLSYFKTETMSLDIFVRDREAKTDINIEMRKTNSSDSKNSNQSNSSSSNSEGEGSQELSVRYKTLLMKDLKNSIDSLLSQQGSYTFLASSGQVLVRDKNENVKMVQKLISDFNSKFKDTVEITLTLYKVSKEKGDTRGLDFKALGSKFDFSANSMVSTAFGGNANGNMFGVGYKNGDNNAVFNFLREYGDTEILNPISFETQTNILKTVKVANNYGYISSIKTTSDNNTGTTASVEPSSVADGGFVSALTKVIDNETIAIDLYTTTMSLSKFNTVTAFGNTIQTPETAEQSVDGYHRVKVGVPYILVSHKYEENKNKSAGLPIGMLDSLGLKADSNKDIYIVIALEAKIRK